MFRASICSVMLICYTSYCCFVWGLVQNTTHTIKCLIDMLNQCPPNSSCDEGSCVCLSQFKRNPDYNAHQNNDFCIVQETAQQTPPGNKSITFDKVFKEAPEAHHIIGGILIPVCIALTVLAAIVLTKKMQLLQRIRHMMFSNRARRPAYEDVVLVGYEQ